MNNLLSDKIDFVMQTTGTKITQSYRKLALRSLLTLSFVGLSTLPTDAAMSTTKTTKKDNVQATLSYEKLEGDASFRGVQLQITRAGQTVFNQTPTIDEYDRPLIDFAENAFQVQDLDGDREPEVIVDFYTGGAHCCTYSLIYRYDAAKKTYSAMKHDWGNVGYALERIGKDKELVFKSNDDRFAYAFASFAASGFPLQIWKYQQGKLVDVTRRFPKQVYGNAYQYWQSYQEARSQDSDETKGLLAAYLADKYLLGQERDGWQQVQKVYQERDRREFFAQLRQFLKETGYAK